MTRERGRGAVTIASHYFAISGRLYPTSITNSHIHTLRFFTTAILCTSYKHTQIYTHALVSQPPSTFIYYFISNLVTPSIREEDESRLLTGQQEKET